MLNEFDTTTYRFTASSSGYYQVNVAVRIDVSHSSSSAYVELRLKKNTSYVSYGGIDFYGQYSGGILRPMLNDVVNLNAGDYLMVHLFGNSGWSNLWLKSGSTSNLHINL
ncbi:MAG: hypothetical protein OMM_11795, partial [Candidatus Magnetoglobus multicellularis str. Araruama]